jgi:DNA-binding NtrC family response regulator
MTPNRDLTQPRVLIVEDDASLRALLTSALQELDFEVDSAADGLEGARKVKESVYDILITDLRLPGQGGEEVLRQAKALYPDLIVIVATGYGDLRNAVNMMKLGASDYIQKPFVKDELVVRIRKALEERKWRYQSRAWEGESSEREFGDLVGSSAAMERVKELAAGVAPMRTTVLIQGETGTGKELVARAIHCNSPRKDYPLVSVNCAAIPATLMEDEFFGHEKGAFTDARQLRIGRFEQASRGTIFLDEIGTMPLDLQGKLLRVLQEREFQRIGGTQTIRLDVRVIAATNLKLDERVKRGEFREDLFYRLHVFPIALPPLRERRDDIPLLAGHLLGRFCRQEGLPPKQISQEALKALALYEWPGNVRQLENALEMAVILAGNREYLLPQDFPVIGRSPAASGSLPPVAIPPEGSDFNLLVSRYERALIEEALRLSDGKRSRAALLLHMKRTTLLEKLKKLQSAEPLQS